MLYEVITDSSYYVYAHVIPILSVDGTIQEYISIRQDITEEIMLKEQYSKVMEYASDALFLMGMDGSLIDCSNQAKVLLGYTDERNNFV